jgi:hypothetical protein
MWVKRAYMFPRIKDEREGESNPFEGERERANLSLYMHVVYAFICASRMSENERVFSDMFMIGQSNALGVGVHAHPNSRAQLEAIR